MSSLPADPEVKPNCVADTGAFVAYSGKCTGYLFTYLGESQKLNHLSMIR